MNHFYQSIKAGIIAPVYLFSGDEPLLMEEGLDSLRREVLGSDTWNYELLEGESATPRQVAESASLMPFFGRRLVVVKNISWLSKKKAASEDPLEGNGELEPMLKYLEDPNQSTVLALTVTGNPEKRRKLVKAIAKIGSLVECNSYKGGDLLSWIKGEAEKRGYLMTGRAADMLTLACGNNLTFLRMEIAKVCDYCGAKKEIVLEDVQAVVSRSALISIFELMDGVAERNVEKSVSLFKRMTRDGEPEQKILAMLGKQFRDMLGVKEYAARGLTPREISKELDIHPFVAEKYLKSSRKFKQDELIKFLEILLSADIAHKSGEGELHNLLETAIMRICGGSLR